MLSEYHDRTGKTWCKPADKLLANNRKPIMFDGRPDWCPLVELPEKHGRLIDADELEELFRELIGSIAKKPEMTPVLEHMVRASAMVVDMIEDASTVIEAEG